MPKMRTNFEGLVKLLAKNLYPEPDVFIRELIQNGHDAIQFRRQEEPNLNGKIEILTDARRRTIEFHDNGLGMNEAEIKKFLSTIGTSGTGGRTGEILARGDKADALSTIGQFGIGFLSAFVVAERIEVLTRRLGGETVLRWTCDGSEEYTLEEVSEEGPPIEVGTRVTLYLQKDKSHTLDEDDIKKTITKYADFLPFGIDVNGNGPVNTIDAPWHRTTWENSREYERELSEFLNRRFPDIPLQVIPIDFESPRARGALYISDRHVPGINTPGLVDIFQNRMCIRLNDQELLPEWAKFVRGVIDTPELTPTAARDNVQRDGTYHALRRALGRRIVESLVALSEENRSRFTRICEWHHYHLKGMALHHDDFFDAVVELLPFETTEGMLDLRTYVSRQSAEPGSRIPVYHFVSQDSNQFHDLCAAQGLIAINTSRAFEKNLLKKYVEKHAKTLELRALDTLHDEAIFQTLGEDEQRRYRLLEDALRHALTKVRISNVTPHVRRFEPSSLSAALIGYERSEGVEALEEILIQPRISEGLGQLADEALQKLRESPVTLYLNANNDIVRRLAEERDPEERRFELLLVGLYNAAVLNAQHRMTQDYTRVFYRQLHEYMTNILNLEQKVRHLEEERSTLRDAVREHEEEVVAEEGSRAWVRCFVMMPFDERFRGVERALRAVLQGPPYFFEVVLARDRIVDGETRRNVRHHLRDADFYIADISEHSPNVFLELGWPFFDPDLDRRPKLLLRAKSGKERPEDLGGLIYIEYTSPESEDLEAHFRAELGKHGKALEPLLAARRGRFLAPALLERLPFLANKNHRTLLSKEFGTVETLLEISEESFAQRLPKEHEWLRGVLRQIREHLQELGD